MMGLRSMVFGWQIGLWINGVILGIVAIATFLGFASQWWWGFSYLDYPRPQYCLVLLIGILINLFAPQPGAVKVWHLPWGIPLLSNVIFIAPLFIAPNSTPLTPNFQRLGVLHATFDRDNPDPQQLIQYLNEKPIDVVSILEITPDTLPQFEAGLTNYQLVAAEPRYTSHGSAWFVSKGAIAAGMKPLSSEVIHLPADSDRPILTMTVSIDGEPITFVCFHAIRPQSAARLDYQAQEFTALAHWSQQQTQAGDKWVVIGDFNSTPWARLFREILQTQEWVNSQPGFGLQPTWNSQFPKFLQIPIDHCFHSPIFKTLRREVGAKIGSDHLPLFVELGWNRAN